MRRTRIAAGLVLLLSIAAPARAQITLELVASLGGAGVEPLFLAQPTGDSRLFVVDRPGRIRILDGGVLQPDVFLDIRDAVSNPVDGEGGLLGLVFAPDYATSGVFYVYYTGFAGSSPVDMRSVVSRFTAAGDPLTATSADPQSEAILFSLDQPYSNHNGGTIAIRDGFLYLGLGDGGSGGDPQERAQNDASFFGKLIRLDLSIASPTSDDWEVVAKGLRNPFRFSFDSGTGDLYIGDVGQATREEIDVVRAQDVTAVPAGETPALNFGWDVLEGTLCFDPDPSEPACDDPDLFPPTFEYDHEGGGASVTGGSVYRGSASPSLRGAYFFADAVKARNPQTNPRNLLFQMRWTAEGGLAGVEEITETVTIDGGQLFQPVAIAPDAAGELYVVSRLGSIHRLVPEAGAAASAIAAIGTLAWRRLRERS